MKTHIKNLFFLPFLIATLGFLPGGRVAAQTFTILHSFPKTSTDPAASPAVPSGLILLSNTLYGTIGDSYSPTDVFRVNTDGTGFTNLHGLTYTGDVGLVANLSGDALYGTTAYGGSNNAFGTVFKLNVDGTDFTNVYSFSSDSGAYPNGALVLSSNTLYGVTAGEAVGQHGTFLEGNIVFRVNTDGTGFTNLANLAADGLVLSGSTLYGTTAAEIFAITTDGTGFTNLHSFADAAVPQGRLVVSGNTLYGTAVSVSSSGDSSWGPTSITATGSVFAVHTDGTGFTNLHTFTAYSNFTNSAGALPAGLILSGNTLYGTAVGIAGIVGIGGGSSGGLGTVFKLNTDGTGFATLYDFTGTNHVRNPSGELILSGNTLYGTAISDGTVGSGVVFSLSFAPKLTIVRSGDNLVLSWPTNYAGFDYTGYHLQYTAWTASLNPPAVWSYAIDFPWWVDIDGRRTVTIPIPIFGQMYYRLTSSFNCFHDFDCPPGYGCVPGEDGVNHCSKQ